MFLCLAVDARRLHCTVPRTAKESVKNRTICKFGSAAFFFFFFTPPPPPPPPLPLPPPPPPAALHPPRHAPGPARKNCGRGYPGLPSDELGTLPRPRAIELRSPARPPYRLLGHFVPRSTNVGISAIEGSLQLLVGVVRLCAFGGLPNWRERGLGPIKEGDGESRHGGEPDAQCPGKSVPRRVAPHLMRVLGANTVQSCVAYLSFILVDVSAADVFFTLSHLLFLTE